MLEMSDIDDTRLYFPAGDGNAFCNNNIVGLDVGQHGWTRTLKQDIYIYIVQTKPQES